VHGAVGHLGWESLDPAEVGRRIGDGALSLLAVNAASLDRLGPTGVLGWLTVAGPMDPTAENLVLGSDGGRSDAGRGHRARVRGRCAGRLPADVPAHGAREDRDPSVPGGARRPLTARGRGR